MTSAREKRIAKANEAWIARDGPKKASMKNNCWNNQVFRKHPFKKKKRDEKTW
jgi:hypothetical protein